MLTSKNIEQVLLINPDATIKDLMEYRGYSEEQMRFELNAAEIKKKAIKTFSQLSKTNYYPELVAHNLKPKK